MERHTDDNRGAYAKAGGNSEERANEGRFSERVAGCVSRLPGGSRPGVQHGCESALRHATFDVFERGGWSLETREKDHGAAANEEADGTTARGNRCRATATEQRQHLHGPAQEEHLPAVDRHDVDDAERWLEAERDLGGSSTNSSAFVVAGGPISSSWEQDEELRPQRPGLP